jgi:hypothetical protein
MEATVKLCLSTAREMARFYLSEPRRAWNAEKRAWGLWSAREKLRQLGLVEMYDDIPDEVYRPDWADLLNMYNLVRRRKPRIIIEFGSGCSTLMLAQAIAHNQIAGENSGHLYSVETSEHFKRLTDSYLPRRLTPFVEIIRSEIEFGEIAGTKVLWHKTIPDVVPNLVYLDGPDYQDFSTDVKTQAEGVLLEQRSATDYAILVDWRQATFEFTRANLKRRYKVTTSPTHHWELFEAIS